tara:strand:+ start:8571 stop:8774 length:204 start_codon:yes stop_codon:yes gene_type:complete
MTVISVVESSHVDYALLFLTPYKSKAKVSFMLRPEGDSTSAHWLMDTSLSFFIQNMINDGDFYRDGL